MTQAVEGSKVNVFSIKQCIPPASQGNLFVKCFDLG